MQNDPGDGCRFVPTHIFGVALAACLTC